MGMTKVRKPTNPVRGDGSIIRRYLLGDLAEEQCEDLEERLLTDDETFQELLLVEDELVNDYVSGELPSVDREKFRNHFLCTPDRRQKLEFASALRRYVSETTAVQLSAKTRQPRAWTKSLAAWAGFQNPVAALSLAVVLVVVMAGGLWSIFEIGRLQDQIGLILSQQLLASRQASDSQRQLAEQLRREQDRAAALKHEVDRLAQAVDQRRDLPRPGIVSLMLTPGLVRSMEGSRKLTLTSGSTSVQLKLAVTNDYDRYRAFLERNGGEEILVGDNLIAAPSGTGRLVNLTIPVDILAAGDYALKLKGIPPGGAAEDAGSYFFRVIKK
jgi:hypothetical protein